MLQCESFPSRANCNETTTILDYPREERGRRGGRSICAGRTIGRRDCHTVLRMRERSFLALAHVAGLSPFLSPFLSLSLLDPRSISENDESTAETKSGGKERMRKAEGRARAEREKASDEGATRLTNRSIVGGKTIRSLTARPGSVSLTRSPFFFL